MSILDDLCRCRSVFDIIAVMYHECEDRDGDRRFHEIHAQLDKGNLRTKFVSFQQSIGDEFRLALSSTTLQQLQEGTGLVSPQAIAARYQEFWQWLSDAGFLVHIAAWAMLDALDRLMWEHGNEYSNLYENQDLVPLNSNFSMGFPRVFLRIRSSVTPNLAPVHETEEAVWAWLENLAIVAREDWDSAVRIRVDRLLWEDMLNSRMSTAAVSPKVGKGYFRVEDPPIESGMRNVFWVDAQEPEQYRQAVSDALHTAEEKNASVVVLPELMSSELLESEISEMMKAARFRNIRLAVLGSRHVDAEDRKANECCVFDHSGTVVWRQRKREPFQIPSEAPDHAGCREWIETENSKQVMMLTPHGGMTVQICKDFLTQGMRQLLCRLGCRWFFVPAMTPSLPGQFGDAARDAGKLSGAVCVVANSRCLRAWGGKPAKENDLRYFYAPKKRDKDTGGKKADTGIWIRDYTKQSNEE